MLISEKQLRNIIKRTLLEKKNKAGSYPEESYRDGNVNDMMLDLEGWITDPNDRQEIKQWYLDMKLAHK
jgi:hypothetical protein